MTDIDGTISPMAPRPDEARVSEEVREVLANLAGDFRLVALLSGRSVEDMFSMVPIDDVVMVGNHGMEMLRDGVASDAPAAAPYRSVMAEVAEQLAGEVDPGVIVQPKGLSISLHYRLAEDPRAAQDRLRSLVRPMLTAHSLRIQQGRLVIDVRPDCPVDKGTAVRQLVNDYGLTHVLVLGDDATDTAAFVELREMGREGLAEGVSVAVLSDETADEITDAADFHVDGPDQVADLLAGLVRTVSSSTSLS